MSHYILGEAAAQDLDQIWEYIALDKLAAADRWIARLFDAFDTLAKSPAIGHSRQDLTSLPVLFWPVGAYLVIYRCQSEQIEIVAITQGSRDVPEFLSCRIP